MTRREVFKGPFRQSLMLALECALLWPSEFGSAPLKLRRRLSVLTLKFDL